MEPSLDRRVFADVSVEHAGDVGDGTLFAYRQADDGTIWADYAGGMIRKGHLVGTRDGDQLDFRYSHVTTDGATANGRCRSRIEVLDDGRLRLHERWAWESRPGAGTSTLEELPPDTPAERGSAQLELGAGGAAGTTPAWLDLARRTAAIAQAGLHFTRGDHDRERYEQLRTIAAELAALATEDEVERIRGLFADETGYPTPKVDVRGVVFHGERVLLVRERTDGRWTLPGGFADVDEAPTEAVEREVVEEAGIEVRAAELLAVIDRERRGAPPAPFRTWKLLFRCVARAGELPERPRTAHPTEITGVDWFAEHELPPLSTGRTSPQLLELCFAHRRDPDRPPDVD